MFKQWFGASVWVVVMAVAPVAAVLAQGGAINVGDTVEGTLNDATATYNVVIGEGESVSIALNSDDFDAYLEVRDKNGNVIASDDDSGGSLNSALVFTAPSAGAYAILVRAYGGNATGAYTLILTATTVVELAYNSATPVELGEGDAMINFSLVGNEGDVLNIYTDNPDLDVRLTLLDPTGQQVAYDDDGGVGYAPYLRRVVLPVSGVYALQLAPVMGNVVGALNLMVEQDELPLLDGGPYAVTMGEDQSVERMGFTATAGQTYRLTSKTSREAYGYLAVEQAQWNTFSLSFSRVMEASMVFTASESGLFPVTLDDNSWDGSTEYEVSVVPVN